MLRRRLGTAGAAVSAVELTPPNCIPMRWPAEWRDPASLKLLEGTPINCLVVAQPAGDLAQVVEAAADRAIRDPRD